MVGARDTKSPLHALRGLEDTIVRNIFSYIGDDFAEHVTLTIPACYVSCVNTKGGGKIGRYSRGRCIPYKYDRDIVDELPVTSRLSSSLTIGRSDDAEQARGAEGFVSFAVCGLVEFPKPTNLHVTMLPFIIGKKSSLPMHVQHYYDCVVEKCPYSEEEAGKIGYLTVHESFVEAGGRRDEGLRIQDPASFCTQQQQQQQQAAFSPALEHVERCDLLLGPDMYEGGTYMASSVSDAYEVWDALVDKTVPGIVDEHGGCEQLRNLIGPATRVKANQLVWMTDCTPHMEVPRQKSGYRQFCRLVVTNISHWFADRSTPNPLVCLPEDVIVVYGNNTSPDDYNS